MVCLLMLPANGGDYKNIIADIRIFENPSRVKSLDFKLFRYNN
jgi:hypothetical protein